MKKMNVHIAENLLEEHIKLANESRFIYNLVYCQAVLLEPIECQFNVLSFEWVQDLLLPFQLNQPSDLYFLKN